MPHLYRLAFLLLVLLPAAGRAQRAAYQARTFTLPKELANRNNQFSGLCRRHNQLLLLSESRLQERAEAKIYALDLRSLDQQLRGAAAELSYQKYTIRNLEHIRARLDSAGQVYEGLEGLALLGNEVYLTIETTTPSAYCYLLRGTLDDATLSLTLDERYVVPLPKPAPADGTHIHNAGFEALAPHDAKLLLFFEYNSFGHDNYALELPAGPAAADVPHLVPVARLPFRITDLVAEGRHRFTGINYFYNGADDRVYRPAPGDASARLVQQGSEYQNYCRLISLRYRGHRVRWKPLFELPREYMTYNWEGLAAYRGGYFLINDKYGPSNQSTLLYLQKN